MTALVTGFSESEIIRSMGRAVIFVVIGTTVSFLSEKISYEKEKYSDLFNSLPDTTYITECLDDRRIGDLIGCNETTLKDTGYSREEISGKPISIITPGSIPSPDTENENEPFLVETEHKRKDGTCYPVEMKIRRSSIDERPVYVITSRDISKRKEAENKLRNQAKFLESLIETIPIPFFYKDQNLRYKMCNTALLNLLNIQKTDFIGKNSFDIYPAGTAGDINRSDLEAISSKRPSSQRITIPGGDGNMHTIISNKMGVFSEDGSNTGIITIFQDISSLKKTKEELSRSLHEKTLLLQEVHHRVKNNLAIIIGFLTMQRNLMDDEKCIEAISDAENRIHSLAVVHESIYLSDNITEIDAKEHFENLIGGILTAFSDESNINHSIDANGCKMDIRQAIPSSLIVNEIVTNSVKYAFSGRETGNIYLNIRKDQDGTFTLNVSDDGVGIPEGFDQNKSQTLGIKVIKNIAELQLKGEVKMESGSFGTRWNIKWKK